MDDIQKYSMALDLYDNGEKLEAKKMLETLLKKYPDFEPGKALLKKI